ncbi:MAG: Ribosomal small subunit methyltransferase [Deltaproteobacteria bacterium]|nr:Ribosomal small subunit methyltransferase [Deltaproteobacteria bacterium]
MTTQVHVPILTSVLLDLLQLRPGARCIDATIDGGGHTAAILEQTAPDGKVLGIDRDPELLTAVRQRLADAVDAGRLLLAVGNFRALTRIVTVRHFAPVQAIVFDLGLSSFHFDVSGRGFSFMRDEPLDMRFDPDDTGTETAAEIVNSRSAEELTAIFGNFGEERFAGRIARAIVAQRQRAPLRTTRERRARRHQRRPAAGPLPARPGRTAGGAGIPFAGRPHGEAVLRRRAASGSGPHPHQEAAASQRSGDRERGATEGVELR